MPFKKKIYRHIDGAGVSFVQMVCEQKNLRSDDGITSTVDVVKKIDVSDPANLPKFPDVDSFNDLESQINAGVPLTRVNTSVIVNDDVAEVNRELDNSIDSNPLNTSNDEI